MYKIQTLNKIASKGLDLLSHDNYEVASEMTNPDGIILRSFKMHEMELPETLKAIARAGAGVNNIPVDDCSEKGIVVFNTPGANANGVKELTLAGLLLASRQVVNACMWVQGQKDQKDQVPKLVEKQKSNYKGPEIKGKKLGVIGLGAIGVMVANGAQALGMEVTGYDPFISVDAAWGLSRTVAKAPNLDALLAESDYISLHIPLNDKTRGLMNKEKFDIIKKGVRIVNFARGGLVVNADLLEAVNKGIVASYVTDFPDAEILGNEAITAIPHLGASTPESEENCALMAAAQLKSYIETGNIVNSVNFPETVMEPGTGTRIVVTNKNIPNMVGQITTILADDKINIADMLNRHRDKVAYNIIDLEDAVTDDTLNKIRAVEGIINVRKISFS